MSAELKVTRIDSPLARGQEPQPPTTDPDPLPAPRPASDNAQAPPIRLDERRSPSPTPAAQLAAPPALEERLALVSHRVPESLKVNLGHFTRALRERRGGGAPVSQKTLPEQEVLALALWLLGDPHNEQDLERIAAAHDEYRAGQLAAAADALRRLRNRRWRASTPGPASRPVGSRLRSDSP